MLKYIGSIHKSYDTYSLYPKKKVEERKSVASKYHMGYVLHFFFGQKKVGTVQIIPFNDSLSTMIALYVENNVFMSTCMDTDLLKKKKEKEKEKKRKKNEIGFCS